MQYTNLGSTGLKISRIALGMMTYGSSKWRPWILDEDAAKPIVRRAIEGGINLFDTADMYSGGASEVVTGRLLRDLQVARDKAVVATKVFFPVGDDPNQKGLSRKHVLHAIDDSLRRLQLDYVDLYQIHRYDYDTPIEETMEVLHEVVKAGKARYIGASSMYAWQFAQMQYTADLRGWTRFASMQNHYNIVYREEEREMIPFCIDEGVGIIPWSPLARGFIAGNRSRNEKSGETTRAQSDDYAQKMYYQPADYDIVDRITDVAKQRGVSNAQIALAWLLHQPGVTAPIIGASKLEHLDDLLKAIELKLSDEELKSLAKPYQPHPVLGHS
jgi:aryl-alcohol dehydrogenase-like predicted oxidoreductase